MARERWAKTTALVEAAKSALEAERPMTIRQLFYRLVSIHAIENTLADYKRVSRVLTDARERSEIPFAWIVDRTRPTYAANVFENPEEFMEAASNTYRRDYWTSQPVYVELWSEKDSVIGSIQEVTDSLGVMVRVGRGFNSASVADEIAQLFSRIEKLKQVFYLGDHDPSGRCIEIEIRSRLQRYGSGKFKMKRLAIHAGDIRRYNLPPLRIKETDTRKHSFRERYGENCVELDALPVEVLRRRVRKAIESLMDKEAWDRAVEVEKVEQDSIKALMQSWPGMKNES